jgi:cell division topological specificity factor
MANFFDRMLGRNNKEGSSAVAKSRLQVVLVHDRINLPPERLREMEAEILAVIARYVPVNPEDIVIMLEQPDRNSGRLVAQIPFGKGRYSNEHDFSTYTEDDDLEMDDTASKSSSDSPALTSEPASEQLEADAAMAEDTSSEETPPSVAQTIETPDEAPLAAEQDDESPVTPSDDSSEKPIP